MSKTTFHLSWFLFIVFFFSREKIAKINGISLFLLVILLLFLSLLSLSFSQSPNVLCVCVCVRRFFFFSPFFSFRIKCFFCLSFVLCLLIVVRLDFNLLAPFFCVFSVVFILFIKKIFGSFTENLFFSRCCTTFLVCVSHHLFSFEAFHVCSPHLYVFQFSFCLIYPFYVSFFGIHSTFSFSFFFASPFRSLQRLPFRLAPYNIFNVSSFMFCIWNIYSFSLHSYLIFFFFFFLYFLKSDLISNNIDIWNKFLFNRISTSLASGWFLFGLFILIKCDTVLWKKKNFISNR